MVRFPEMPSLMIEIIDLSLPLLGLPRMYIKILLALFARVMVTSRFDRKRRRKKNSR